MFGQFGDQRARIVVDRQFDVGNQPGRQHTFGGAKLREAPGLPLDRIDSQCACRMARVKRLDRSQVGGEISAVRPRISEMFAAQLPITVPSAIGCWWARAVFVATASSGALVP